MNIDLLKQLYSINSKSHHEEEISEFIQGHVKAYQAQTGENIRVLEDKKGNLLITKGLSETYPCLCAHMDEVHHKVNDIVILESGGYLLGWSNSRKGTVGIGADDKNGIFIALMALERLPAVKLLFTVEEESGGGGARAVDIKAWLSDVRFVIQCDRRNGTDFITTAGGVKLASKAFKKEAGDIFKSYGFKSETGMFTDVQVLKENKLPVSACNLSCGYYNPHTERECTYIPELENTFHAVLAVCNALTNMYPHEFEGRVYADIGYKFGNNYGTHYGGAYGRVSRYDPVTKRWIHPEDHYKGMGYGSGLGYERAKNPYPILPDNTTLTPSSDEMPCRNCSDTHCITCEAYEKWKRPTPRGSWEYDNFME